MPKYPQDPIIRRLFYKGQPISYGKGEIILGQTSSPDGVYFIATGYVKVYSISLAGDEYIHIIYGPGEIFPLMWAYLRSQTDSLFYETITPCVFWRLSRDWFHEFITTRVDVSHALSLQLAQQFRIYNERVDNLEFKKASEKVAYCVLFLASRFGVQKPQGYLIDPPITHELFANTINLARESVSRELEKMEKNGILELKNHHILIKDVEALAGSIGREINLQQWYLE